MYKHPDVDSLVKSTSYTTIVVTVAMAYCIVYSCRI